MSIFADFLLYNLFQSADMEMSASAEPQPDPFGPDGETNIAFSPDAALHPPAYDPNPPPSYDDVIAADEGHVSHSSQSQPDVVTHDALPDTRDAHSDTVSTSAPSSMEGNMPDIICVSDTTHGLTYNSQL